MPDIKKFSNCLYSQNHLDIVQQNDNLAGIIGLQAQQEPLLIDGAQPYAVFQQAIAKVQLST